MTDNANDRLQDWIAKKYFKIKARVQVKMPSGKIYYRDQWVLPGEAKSKRTREVHLRKINKLVEISQKKNPSGPVKTILENPSGYNYSEEDIKRMTNAGYKFRWPER